MPIPMQELTSPPPEVNGNGGNILRRVNPLAILIGMGFASFFTWFISAGGSGESRRATHLPEFILGQDVNGQTITGVRTRWEYQLGDDPAWTPEELI